VDLHQKTRIVYPNSFNHPSRLQILGWLLGLPADAPLDRETLSRAAWRALVVKATPTKPAGEVARSQEETSR
jgi:hypothetical protein